MKNLKELENAAELALVVRDRVSKAQHMREMTPKLAVLGTLADEVEYRRGMLAGKMAQLTARLQEATACLDRGAVVGLANGWQQSATECAQVQAEYQTACRCLVNAANTMKWEV